MTMYSFWFKYYVERVVAPFNKYPVKYCYQSDRSTKMFMKVLATWKEASVYSNGP